MAGHKDLEENICFLLKDEGQTIGQDRLAGRGQSILPKIIALVSCKDSTLAYATMGAMTW